MSQSQTILDDIRVISNQFKSEVPRRRGAWPNAIRQRVQDLHRLGMSSMAISKQTEIPYHTVLKWNHSGGEFKEVNTVAVPTLVKYSTTDITTVTVTTPKGFRIAGLSFEQVLRVFERFE
jgi:uncharacterized protein (UPF0248 family)